MSVYQILPYKLNVSSYGQQYFPNKIREGFYVKKIVEEGHYGIGEVAFFPHINHKVIKSYGFDMCDQHLLWKSSKPNIGPHTINISALIDTFDVNLAIGLAKKFIDEGFRCLKIKISGHYFYESLQILRNIIKIDSEIKLRLDANKTFDLISCKNFLAKLNLTMIDYIEDPLNDLNEVFYLKDLFDIKVAIDEYLIFDDIKRFKSLGIDVFIIKPSRFFSIDNLNKTIETIKNHEGRIIFSTLFESEYFACFSSMLINDFDLLNDHHGIYCPGFFDVGSLFDKPKISLNQAYEYLCHF